MVLDGMKAAIRNADDFIVTAVSKETLWRKLHR
jgi:hypothetical protein